jgi:hypothetical protein
MEPTASLSTDLAPPFNIIIKYFITAVGAFFLLNILLVFNYSAFSGHHFQPKILALTHIATLGWITMIIFGALFQLIPVVLQVKLFSEILAKIQFWIFTFGVVTLVYSFWFFLIDLPLTIGASLINLAILIFLINVIVTLTRVKEWNITGTYLAAALFYLLITGIVGLMMAVNLWHPYFSKNHLIYLGYHVNIAVIGWVSMVIMGVTFKLISMFTLSHNFSITSGKWAFGFINTGLIGFIILLHLPESNIFYLISAIMIVAGIFLFLYQVYIIFKNRLRKKLDSPLKFTFTAYVFLGITTLSGFSLLFINYPASANITLVYGYLIFFGFISMLIIGQMYKIVPFLTWYHKYSRKAGIEKVPMLREMYSEKLAKMEYYFMIAGISGTIVSLLLNINFLLLISFSVMLVSVTFFTINIIKILVK